MPGLMEQPVAAFRRQLIGNPARGVAFEIPHHRHEIGCGKHGVKVVVGNDPAVDAQPFVLAAMEPRLHGQIASRRRGEDREPGDDRGRDEVRGARFVNAVAAALGGRLGEAQLRRHSRSEVKLRNEGEFSPGE